MTTPSPKLGLALPAQVDQFSTDDLKNNWTKLDNAPGIYICTSTTRPSWGLAQSGMEIYETNTRLRWVWDGTAWFRPVGQGLLKTSGGAWAIGERNTDFSTTSNTPVKVVSVTSVVVPDGNRPLRIEVSWRKATNGAGNFQGTIFQSNTNNTGPKLASWYFPTAPTNNDNNAGGGTYFALLRDGLPPSTYDFSFQIDGPSGTSTLVGTSVEPITIFAHEL